MQKYGPQLQQLTDETLKWSAFHQIFQKKFFFENQGNGPKTSKKHGFFEYIEKFRYYFLVNLFYNEDLYYLLFANQIAGFFNHKSVK